MPRNLLNTFVLEHTSALAVPSKNTLAHKCYDTFRLRCHTDHETKKQD